MRIWSYILGCTALILAQQLNLGWTFITDTGGPDDEVAQADVNFMGFNKDNPDYAEVAWSWDDTSFPGANTGDGCSLWDMNKNGLADFALCTSIQSSSAGQVNQIQTQLFDCKDTKELTCPFTAQPGITDPVNASMMLPQTGKPRLKSFCKIDFVADPFMNVKSHQSGQQNSTADTRAICRLYYDELKQGPYPGVLQNGDPQLINVCTYPSSQPNSNFKDCIVDPGTAFLVLNKWTNTAANCALVNKTGFACPPYDNGETRCTIYQCNNVPHVTWNFTYTGTGVNIQKQVFGWGWTALTPLAPQTYKVTEDAVMPQGWINIGFTCADGQNNPNAVILKAGQTLACYYLNYFGNYSSFVAEYGAVNTSKGILGNLTLDTYSPNRTDAPTMAGYVPPTPACPASSDTTLANFYSTCHETDFYNAQCSPSCLPVAQQVQTTFTGTSADNFVTCVNDYNTNHGVIFSSAAMDLINTRIAGTSPICSNGNLIVSLAPTSSATCASASVSLLAVILLFL